MKATHTDEGIISHGCVLSYVVLIVVGWIWIWVEPIGRQGLLFMRSHICDIRHYSFLKSVSKLDMLIKLR